MTEDMDHTIAAIDDASSTLPLPGLALHVEAASRSMAQVARAARRGFVDITGAFAVVMKSNHVLLAPTIYRDGYRRHRRRCPICNPAGFPKPLAADGHEYRRRTRARRRRNRR